MIRQVARGGKEFTSNLCDGYFVNKSRYETITLLSGTYAIHQSTLYVVVGSP